MWCQFYQEYNLFHQKWTVYRYAPDVRVSFLSERLGEKSWSAEKAKEQFYAGFGMKSPNEVGISNFGLEPFEFDIETYINVQISSFHII